MTGIKFISTTGRIFRKYTGKTFDQLDSFAKFHDLNIVDKYWSYDNEHKRHMPVIETTSIFQYINK